MLDLRLYRVTLIPFAALLAIAAFSLHARPGTPATTAPAQDFNGSATVSTMEHMASAYPYRTPGSASDDALAAALARAGAPAGASLAVPGFAVRTDASSVETTLGAETVRTVVASREGSGTGAGIALIADRGSSGQGPAALAPTAVLLELASIYANLLPQRPLTLVSTSGGPSAMGAVASLLPPDTEAAIVIGDIADARGRGPYVVPWSAAGGLAPVQLRLTVESALAGALSRPVGDVALTEQMARLALPITTGAQGLLERAGIPTVLVSADGESDPLAAASAPASVPDVTLIGEFGQGLLATTTALDAAAALPTVPTRDLSFGTQILSGSAVRAVVGALLLSLLACTLDVVARARRRRVAIARQIGWTLSFAAAFLLAGIFAAFLGAGGLLPATPAAAVTPAQLPIAAEGVAALVSIGLLFILVWVLRAAALARARRGGPADPVGATAALLIVVTATAAALWIANPYTAALLILPGQGWLVVLTREHGHRPPWLGALCVVVSLLPAIAAAGLICSVLHVEPLALAWTLVLLVAGGGLPPIGVILGALTAGTFVAAAVLLLRGGVPGGDAPAEVTVRGPLSYAGPGSLGGTESALRR